MSDRERTNTVKTALDPRWTIAEVFAQWPQAAVVFTRLRMACVGCPMAAFETPAEAARAYGLDPSAVLTALGRAVKTETSGFSAKQKPESHQGTEIRQ